MRELNALMAGLLVAIAVCAGVALRMSWISAAHVEAIYSASRFDLALSCGQAKAEMITLAGAYDRSLLGGDPVAKRSLHLASEIMKGRIASMSGGSWRHAVAEHPQLEPLIGSAILASDRIGVALDGATSNTTEMHRLLDTGRKSLERLCTELHSADAERVEGVKGQLTAANTKTRWLVMAFLATISAFACVMLRQNLLTRLSYRKQAELLKDFEILATHDRLTGLANRTMLLTELDKAMKRIDDGGEVGLITFDLDRFKLINDTLGHAVGDQLLISVAKRLEQFAADYEHSLVARLGGDEFIVVVSARRDVETLCVHLADTIIDAIAEPHIVGGHTVWVRATAGIACAPKHVSTRDDLIRSSDIALYKGKSKGRGHWHVFTADLDEALINRQKLEHDMVDALARDEFFLDYQPIVGIESGQIETVEALMRWRHPSRGLISPADFIPIAEETGLIVDLAEALLLKACHDARKMPETWSVAFNLSPVQFARGDLLASIERALHASGLDAKRLELEVTESTLIANDDKFMAIMTKLKQLGPRIALDDFGTGYSSLSYLRRFEFDKLKIDRAFMRGIPDDQQAEDIVRAITALGAALQMTVTAEGIETAAQCAALRRLGCDQAQGYVIARPLARDDLLRRHPMLTQQFQKFAAEQGRSTGQRRIGTAWPPESPAA